MIDRNLKCVLCKNVLTHALYVSSGKIMILLKGTMD